MPLIINTNVASMRAQLSLDGTRASTEKNFQRLSSGVRIHSAADDAVGLSQSDQIGMHASGFSVAGRNANNAISMAQTAEGALASMGTLVARMRDLSVQAMNGDLTSTDRAYLNTEFVHMRSEIDRIANSTTYNQINLLNQNTAVDFQVGVFTTANDRIALNTQSSTTTDFAINASTVDTTTSAQASLGQIDLVLGSLITRRENYASVMTRVQHAQNQARTMATNFAAARSRIRDTDIASETSELSRSQIVLQASTAVIAQANQSPQVALSLLRG